jgi:hypothetical protein
VKLSKAEREVFQKLQKAGNDGIESFLMSKRELYAARRLVKKGIAWRGTPDFDVIDLRMSKYGINYPYMEMDCNEDVS